MAHVWSSVWRLEISELKYAFISLMEEMPLGGLPVDDIAVDVEGVW
jgi:hypothetical protein